MKITHKRVARTSGSPDLGSGGGGGRGLRGGGREGRSYVMWRGAVTECSLSQDCQMSWQPFCGLSSLDGLVSQQSSQGTGLLPV